MISITLFYFIQRIKEGPTLLIDYFSYTPPLLFIYVGHYRSYISKLLVNCTLKIKNFRRKQHTNTYIHAHTQTQFTFLFSSSRLRVLKF